MITRILGPSGLIDFRSFTKASNTASGNVKCEAPITNGKKRSGRKRGGGRKGGPVEEAAKDANPKI